MKRRPPWPLLAGGALACAVVLSLGIGVTRALQAPPGSPEAAWQQRLQPLEEAPLAPGSRVALVPPAGVTSAMAHGWLYEAEWRRPDVLWGLASDWPVPVPLTRMAALEASRLPAGWRVVWEKDGVVLAERDR